MKKKTMVWIVLSVLLALALGVFLFVNQPSFGRAPRGARLERIRQSPNYRDGKFQNLSPTVQLTSDKSMLSNMIDFLFRQNPNLRPSAAMPMVKTDLKAFDRNEDMLVWLGHSSVFFQLNGKRFLIDPVLLTASPVGFFNKAFPGTGLYAPDDLPDVDYLLISHDHWDHLDYETIKRLRGRIGKVVCGLGVGEHFERWGFASEQLIELDWNEQAVLAEGFTLHCLPARHFSGRGFSPNSTLWVSYLLETPSKKVYLSGDGGYDTHFAHIREQFGPIDWAIMENGQYGEGWKFIHLLPEDLLHAIKDLDAKHLMTVHNSKYALAMHSWKEPLDNVYRAAQKDSLPLVTPKMGEVVLLNDSVQDFQPWW